MKFKVGDKVWYPSRKKVYIVLIPKKSPERRNFIINQELINKGTPGIYVDEQDIIPYYIYLIEKNLLRIKK